MSLLIRQDNLRLFPTEVRRAGGMALFKSQFGTGWMASGNAGGIETLLNQSEEDKEGALVLVAQESKNFQTLEFLSAEAMGVDTEKVSFLQELQGVSVQDERSLVQGRSGIPCDFGRTQV